MASPSSLPPASTSIKLPRITITYCTQCRWMLRAAYFAQELLSTFGESLGEVALLPARGGTFIVCIETASSHATEGSSDTTARAAAHTTDAGGITAVLWDRRIDGGFPEVKDLKRRLRDVIEPGRDLGHVDRVKPGGVTVKAEVEGHGGADAGTGASNHPKQQKTPDSAPAAAPAGGAEAGREGCEDCA